MMQTETSVTADARVSVPRALKNGSVVVALSSVIWGLGCFVRKQFAKGALLLAAEVGIILYMISSGFYNLTKLITLGDVEQQKVWNEAKSIFEYVDGDRSLVILLYGIVTVAVLLCGVLLLRLSVKSAYQAEQLAKTGKPVPGFRDDMTRLFDRDLHKPLLTLPILGASILFAKAGSKLRARYRRCKTYLRLTGDADFITVKQLASETQQTPDYVANDLNRMIRKKMLPDAHMDQQKTCLMLGSDTYQQYLDAQKALEERQAEEERIRRECEEDPRRAELYRTVEEGKAYIRQIKEANDALPDEDISNKLFRLEDVTTRIFDHVEKHPEKLSEIGKFMRYYLPTTLKLVNAYREFEQQPAQGENIRSAKEEIKKSLDVINQAFEKLLDSLFEDDALDISTDISVLQTMLAQEGLTGSDFSQEDRKS